MTASNTPVPANVWRKICHPNETVPQQPSAQPATPTMVPHAEWKARTEALRAQQRNPA